MSIGPYPPVGARALLTLWSPGGSTPKLVGRIQVWILNVHNGECDCIISPAELQVEDNRRYDTEQMLRECDVALEDLRMGPVYVLANMNTDWVTW